MSSQSDDQFLILSDEDMLELGLTTDAIVGCIEQALVSQAQGRTWTSPKAALIPGDGRYMMTTLSASDVPRATVVKSVMVSPRNPARGRLGVEGAIMVQDSETGALLAIMQAAWITGVRTAGLSSVAAKRMANPDARSVAFIGAGQQARSHLQAYADLFPLRDIRVFGRGRPNIERLCTMARELGLEAQICGTPEEALEGADLAVSSVTLAFDLEPFLDARWLPPGAFAAITDAGVPWRREGMETFGKIYIDDVEQERGSANPMVEPQLVKGDLQALAATGHESLYDPEIRNAFVYRGMAIGDFAVAGLVYERAVAAGMGKRMSWGAGS